MARTNLALNPVQLTSVPTTSGTFVDFANIPAGTKRITLTLNGVSSNNVSHLLAQLGTSAGIVTTGYTSFFSNHGSAATASASVTNGFGVWSGNSADITYGVLTLVHLGNNVWTYGFAGGLTNGTQNYGCDGGGSVTLPGTLTSLRLTTQGGTAVFDLGSVNVLYE